MMKKLALALALLSAVVFYASVCTSQPLLSILSLYSEDGHLCVDFYLKNALETETLASIKNGVPALLSYKVEVWEDKANWYDKLVSTFTYSYKIAYDNWDTLFAIDAVSQGRQETGKARNVADLIHMVCNQKKFQTCSISHLNRDASYYVTIQAAIQSLSAERVREVESWLGGGDSGGGREAGGLLGFVVDMFASKAQRVETKSNVFALEALTK
jgi:hypothetical protein